MAIFHWNFHCTLRASSNELLNHPWPHVKRFFSFTGLCMGRMKWNVLILISVLSSLLCVREMVSIFTDTRLRTGGKKDAIVRRFELNHLFHLEIFELDTTVPLQNRIYWQRSLGWRWAYMCFELHHLIVEHVSANSKYEYAGFKMDECVTYISGVIMFQNGTKCRDKTYQWLFV
jgi:hypothetical protein